MFNVLCARAMNPSVSIKTLQQMGTGYGLTKRTLVNGVTVTNNVDFETIQMHAIMAKMTMMKAHQNRSINIYMT